MHAERANKHERIVGQNDRVVATTLAAQLRVVVAALELYAGRDGVGVASIIAPAKKKVVPVAPTEPVEIGEEDRRRALRALRRAGALR